MDWNSSNNGPVSPKKKLHLKAKGNLADKVNNVRNDMKNARDISARNLLCGGGDSSISDSTLEEVVMIEEEATDYVSDVDDERAVEEEYYEEVVEDSDTDDSALEPLPPPIEIPDALKVKDSDDDAEDDNGADVDSDLSDDDNEKISAGKSFSSAQQNKKGRVLAHEPDHLRPNTIRGYSELTSSTSTKESPKGELESKVAAPVVAAVNPLRPKKIRGHSYLTGDKPQERKKPVVRMESHEETENGDEPGSAPVTPKARATAVTPTTPKTPTSMTSAPAMSSLAVCDDGRPDVSWQKPDWTKDSKLRSTGKSAAENLAKPITNLPHMKKCPGDDMLSTTTLAASVTPSAGRSPAAAPHKPPTAPSPRTPTTSRKVPIAPRPKSAPQKPKARAPAPPVAAATDDDSLPAIVWEKPEWTKKKVLRDTSKTEKLMSGEKLERPIGGIRQVDDR